MNTRLLKDNIHGGIEWFTFETLSRITKEHPEHRFFFIFDRQYDESFIFSQNIEPVILRPETKHPFIWYYWNEIATPRLLKKIDAGLYLSPDGMIPIKSDIPAIPVIHDISFQHRSGDLPFLKSAYYRYYFRKFALKANRIATVSGYSKNDMVKTWNIDPRKIDIIYNGASENFFPENGTSIDATREAYTQNYPYFLFVGNLSPRKNIPNLIRAYNIFRERSVLNIKLLITGGRFFLNGEMDRTVRESPFRNDIIFTGHKDRDQLRHLYCASESLVFVPWYEGFGIPVIEAMRCGTPVITSDCTSLPEIAGEAALLVDPSSPEAISGGMLKLTYDNSLRNRLKSLGLTRSKSFSWDRTAELLWETIEKVIKT